MVFFKNYGYYHWCGRDLACRLSLSIGVKWTITILLGIYFQYMLCPHIA